MKIHHKTETFFHSTFNTVVIHLQIGIEPRKTNPATNGKIALDAGILESLTTHFGPRSFPLPYAGRLSAVRGPYGGGSYQTLTIVPIVS